MVNNILKINLLQNFVTILVKKIDKKMDKYIKNKNQRLIILVMKFKYVIVSVHINKELFVMFTKK